MSLSAPKIRPLCAALALVLAGGCTWTAWVPEDRNLHPKEIIVNPADLAHRLELDRPYVDELGCYGNLCQQRFRVVAPESGLLTVSVIPELASQDAQARFVLESSRGVLGRADSGRGPRSDPVVLAVRQPVEPGTYFVLMQSIGGRLPYQITASLTPGEGPVAATPPPRPAPKKPEGPEPKLLQVVETRSQGAGYDPAASFDQLRTFGFPASGGEGSRPQPGTPLESPEQRQIRRLLADGLERKGLRQAAGGETPDLLVDFALGATTRRLASMSLVSDWYDVAGLGWANGPDTRGTLTVDMLETRSNRIAWRAWTTKGLGPGIRPGEEANALLREAVDEVLAGFPPR